MTCPNCKSDNLVAGYTDHKSKLFSAEQIKTDRNNYVWIAIDTERRCIPNSGDVQCRECDCIFSNPLR